MMMRMRVEGVTAMVMKMTMMQMMTTIMMTLITMKRMRQMVICFTSLFCLIDYCCSVTIHLGS